MPIPLFLIPMLAGLIAQGLKPLLNKHFYSTLEIAGRKVPRYGGMPSAHSAFITSLVATVGLTDGVMTSSFAIACALFILTIDDALRMRMFLEKYGLALTILVKRLPPEAQNDFPYLEARLGHRLEEVIVGSVLGITITIITLFFLGFFTSI